MTISFYGANNPNGQFSNFFPSEITTPNGRTFQNIESMFQAWKFAKTDINWAEEIRLQINPVLSAKMGKSRLHPIDPNWESIKDEVMFYACELKFTNHKELRQALLDTKDEVLVEASPYDYYWGAGRDGSGQNQLGKTLMKLREKLRA